MVNDTPSAAEELVRKVTAAPDATLDVEDIQTATNERDEIVEHAKTLAQAEREKLRKEIAEAAATAEAPAEQEALNKLADDIQNISAPPAAPEETPAGPSPFDFEKTKSGFMAKIGKYLNAVGGGTLLSIASFLSASDSPFLKGIANYLRGFAEPGVIRESMEKRLGAKILTTPEDAGHVETLRAQYQTKLDAEKKDPKTYSFQTFYAQKIAELAGRAKKESYTLADLADLPSAEQAKVEEEKTKKEEEEKKDKEKKEALNDPDARKTAHAIAIAQAINDVVPGLVDIPDIDPKTASRAALTENILFAISGERAASTLGIDVDGGDLEQADGTNWFYDADVSAYFEQNLRDHPEVAARDLLASSFDGGRAKTTMPRVQEALRKRLTAFGLEAAPTSPSPDAPAETPAGTDA